MICRLPVAGLILMGASLPVASAQKVTAGPATDTSVQASPIQAAPRAPVVDASMQASPVSFGSQDGPARLLPKTALAVKLLRPIDSGTLKNGQSVSATLEKPVRSGDTTIPEGTSVELSVVGTVPAGRMGAAGEFSLQLVRVGKLDVFTEIQTYRGDVGKKDLPDSAAATGTDAGLASGALLTFHVQPPPQPENGPPANVGNPPGSINGTARGSAPPAGSTAGSSAIQSIDNSAVNGLATTPSQTPK